MYVKHCDSMFYANETFVYNNILRMVALVLPIVCCNVTYTYTFNTNLTCSSTVKCAKTILSYRIGYTYNIIVCCFTRSKLIKHLISVVLKQYYTKDGKGTWRIWKTCTCKTTHFFRVVSRGRGLTSHVLQVLSVVRLNVVYHHATFWH